MKCRPDRWKYLSSRDTGSPERKRTTRWPEFIRTHLAVLAGTDFFSVEVLTLRGLVTSTCSFSSIWRAVALRSRGSPEHPNERWMMQMARNVTMERWGFLQSCRYLIQDRDTKYTQAFRAIIKSGHVRPLVLPPLSPNLNAFAERWFKIG